MSDIKVRDMLEFKSRERFDWKAIERNVRAWVQKEYPDAGVVGWTMATTELIRKIRRLVRKLPVSYYYDKKNGLEDPSK